ncbi:hypothetical protein QQ056_01815 [Oscillatoria laete-virens NRMC-F 0139]|nr:hypothetical protein [Oscillatoria laete-virens]MDL5052305.1 hypothetical protein [Oscillatoria laete-virens NRMC-F 0139]
MISIMINPLRNLFPAMTLIALSVCLIGCASTSGGNDAPFDKMIVKDRANYWRVPPGGGAAPDGQFSRGQRLRIIGHLAGYLEVETTGGKSYYIEPDAIGDMSDSPVQPRINF